MDGEILVGDVFALIVGNQLTRFGNYSIRFYYNSRTKQAELIAYRKEIEEIRLASEEMNFLDSLIPEVVEVKQNFEELKSYRNSLFESKEGMQPCYIFGIGDCYESIFKYGFVDLGSKREDIIAGYTITKFNVSNLVKVEKEIFEHMSFMKKMHDELVYDFQMCIGVENNSDAQRIYLLTEDEFIKMKEEHAKTLEIVKENER